MVERTATADRGRRRAGIGIALGLLTAGILYLSYTTWGGGDRPLAVRMKCLTARCGYERARPLTLGEMIPARCPKCEADSLVPAHPCPACQTPVILNEDRGLPPPARCPACGAEVWHGA